MLREHLKNQTELGLKVKAVMDAGGLVSDEIVVDMVKDATSKPAAAKGFILDGFPRNIAQAEILSAQNILGDDYHAVLLNLPDDVIAARLAGRRVCLVCGAVFHIENLPPKAEGVCDLCGAELTQRDDDKTEVVLNRLKTYHEISEPVAGFYEKAGRLVTIDSSGDADAITKAIISKICP